MRDIIISMTYQEAVLLDKVLQNLHENGKLEQHLYEFKYVLDHDIMSRLGSVNFNVKGESNE